MSTMLPYGFTLQSCYGHFVCAAGRDPQTLEPIAPVHTRNSAGKAVKTILYKGKAVNTGLTAKFTVLRTWRAGTYKFYVYAADTAGNAQVKVAWNKLVIK